MPPKRSHEITARSVTRHALLARVEGEDRLWRGMKLSYAFMVIDQGWSEVLHRGAIHQHGPGLVSLKQAGEIYAELRRDGPTSYDIVMIDVAEVHAARDAIAPRREVAIGVPPLAVSDPRVVPLLALRAKLRDNLRDSGCAFADESAVAEAALALASIGTAAPVVGQERPAVRRARDYLLERIAEPIVLDDLADHVHMDKYHLIRAFRAEVGVAPYQFLTYARIHRAQRLLREGLAPSQVAAAVGYYDQSQLHRHFVRISGVTPGRFAREHHGRSSSERTKAAG